MSSASDNAAQLKKSLLTTYNRARQQQITTGILGDCRRCQCWRIALHLPLQTALCMNAAKLFGQ